MSSNKPLLEDTNKGFTVKYRDKYLYSKYSPIESSSKKADRFELAENTLYIIPSPLLYYGISELENRLPTTSSIINIEVDIELYKITSLKDRTTYIESGFDFFQLLNSIDFSSFRNVQLLILSGSYSLFRESYDRLYQHSLNYLHNYWKNRYTLTQMGMLWIKNSLKNIKNIHNDRPFSELKTDKPIVIVGAGESTELYLDRIVQYRDDIFLYCVDTALQVLLDYGIKPDLVLALEAQYYNLPDFYGSKDLNIDLLYDLSSYPGVLNTLKGKRYYSVTSFSKNRLLNKVAKELDSSIFLPPLGSVGITAIYTALKITNGAIFLMGLDFSYRRGKTHSRGTPYHHTSLENWSRLSPGDSYINCLKRPLITVANKRGVDENSDSILLDYAKHTKELLSGVNRVYDMTITGMDIGVPYITEDRFHTMVKKRYPMTHSNTDINHNCSIFTDELEHIRDSLIMIDSYLKKGEPHIDIIKARLKEIDYLFIYFPENRPLELISKNNILRFYYSILRYSRLLNITI